MASGIGFSWGLFSTRAAQIESAKEVFVKNPEVILSSFVTLEQEEAFLEIYTILDTTAYLQIFCVKGRLDELASKVDKVSPIQFLVLIQKHPKLRECLSRLKAESLKFPSLFASQSPWERTVSQLEENLLKEKISGIQGLDELLHVVESQHKLAIEKLIESNQFRELLEYFVF